MHTFYIVFLASNEIICSLSTPLTSRGGVDREQIIGGQITHRFSGRAKSPYAQPENTSDRMLALRELAGLNGTGYEPDIEMGFYKDEQEDAPIVIFGDAKRYGKSDIASAYKETVPSTMIAFGHWGGLQIDTSASWTEAFQCTVRPFFTLFYVKNIINNIIFRSPREQRENEEPCPPIIAIELEYMEENSEELYLLFQEIENKVSQHIP